MKTLKNNNGNTMIELMMVTTLLLLFGITIFTLIISGSDTQERITKNKTQQVDARIAQSYVNVRIRQSDSENAIRVEQNPYDADKHALVLTTVIEDAEMDINDIVSETWIFSYNGKLLECILYEDEELQPQLGTEIVDILSYDAILDDENNTIQNIVCYEYSDKEHVLENTLYLRSE